MSTRGSVLLTVLVGVATLTPVLSAQQPGGQLYKLRISPPSKAAPLFPVKALNGLAPQTTPAPVPPQLFTEVAKILPPDLSPRVVCGMTLLPAPLA